MGTIEDILKKEFDEAYNKGKAIYGDIPFRVILVPYKTDRFKYYPLYETIQKKENYNR